MIKKLLIAALTAVAISASACWLSQDNFDGNYIAGINNYLTHFEQTAEESCYLNGVQAAMPFTVWVKIAPRDGNRITTAMLQYKVLPAGQWVTVRTVTPSGRDMNYDHAVALFGRNCIDIPGLAAGTGILIRVYLSDGICETGDPANDIPENIPDLATMASGGTYSGGWTAPFVFRVIYNGKRRPK